MPVPHHHQMNSTRRIEYLDSPAPRNAPILSRTGAPGHQEMWLFSMAMDQSTAISLVFYNQKY